MRKIKVAVFLLICFFASSADAQLLSPLELARLDTLLKRLYLGDTSYLDWTPKDFAYEVFDLPDTTNISGTRAGSFAGAFILQRNLAHISEDELDMVSLTHIVGMVRLRYIEYLAHTNEPVPTVFPKGADTLFRLLREQDYRHAEDVITYPISMPDPLTLPYKAKFEVFWTTGPTSVFEASGQFYQIVTTLPGCIGLLGQTIVYPESEMVLLAPLSDSMDERTLYVSRHSLETDIARVYQCKEALLRAMELRIHPKKFTGGVQKH